MQKRDAKTLEHYTRIARACGSSSFVELPRLGPYCRVVGRSLGWPRKRENSSEKKRDGLHRAAFFAQILFFRVSRPQIAEIWTKNIESEIRPHDDFENFRKFASLRPSACSNCRRICSGAALPRNFIWLVTRRAYPCRSKE